jgi:hypothetical protein
MADVRRSVSVSASVSGDPLKRLDRLRFKRLPIVVVLDLIFSEQASWVVSSVARLPAAPFDQITIKASRTP